MFRKMTYQGMGRRDFGSPRSKRNVHFYFTADFFYHESYYIVYYKTVLFHAMKKNSESDKVQEKISMEKKDDLIVSFNFSKVTVMIRR